MGRIRGTSTHQDTIARRARAFAIFTIASTLLSFSACNGTILEGTGTDGTDGFTDNGPGSGAGNMTSLEFEADVVGKFWSTTTIDDFLNTGTLPTLAAGYNPKMIINLEKGLKKTLGTTLMASALTALASGDATVAAIAVTVKYTAAHVKWTFTLGDAIYMTGANTAAWYTGILINDDGAGSFISGKLQDTASILETTVGDIVIAGGKSGSNSVNWVGVLPSGGTAVVSSESSGTTVPRLAVKDSKPYLFYVYSAPILELVNKGYGAMGTTMMFSGLSTVATTLTLMVAHVKSGADISPWSDWDQTDLRALTAYQYDAVDHNFYICDNTYNNSPAASDYYAYKCTTTSLEDSKYAIIDDATYPGGASNYDLIGTAGVSIWNPSNIYTPNYPIPSNQTDTIKIGAM